MISYYKEDSVILSSCKKGANKMINKEINLLSNKLNHEKQNEEEDHDMKTPKSKKCYKKS